MTDLLPLAGVHVPVEPWMSLPGTEDRTVDVHPDGCMDVLWSDGRFAVAGPSTVSFAVPHAVGSRSAGLRFPTGILPGLLGVPANELRDLVVPLDAVRPDVADAALDDVEPLRALTRLVRGLAERAPANHAMLAHIARRAGAGASVRDLADEIGYGERHLHRLCRDAFGYGPRRLGMILRFRAASRRLVGGSAHAATASRTGYADQSHMVRDFRALTGRTPSWFTALGRTAGGSPIASAPLPLGHPSSAANRSIT